MWVNCELFSLPSCDRNLTTPEYENAEMENLVSCSSTGGKCH